jgi:hypothetical protein
MNYTAQNNLQVGVDSAALAAVGELYNSDNSDPALRQADAEDAAIFYGDENIADGLLDLSSDNIRFGYVDPQTKQYDPATFSTLSTDPNLAFTGGVNAVRISALALESRGDSVPTTLSRILGIERMDTAAYAVALMDDTVGEVTGGLRPIYGCQEQYRRAMLDGRPENDVIRVYNDRFMINGVTITSDCPPPGSGNWGFADFRNNTANSPGNDQLSDWWLNGFSDRPVQANAYYSTQSGNAISSSQVTGALNTLKNNATRIMIPLIDTDYQGGGSNTKVHVVAYTGMVITDYKSNGPASGRYIEGYLTRMTCTSQCRTGDSSTGTGVVKLQLIH